MSSTKVKSESYFITTYNKLDGKTISREKLIDFTQELYSAIPLQENTHIEIIYNKITKILLNNPKGKLFKIEIKKKFSTHALNGIKKPKKLVPKKIKEDPLKKLGFISANTKIVLEEKVFYLKGALGKFIQKIQRVKELIIIKGDKHSNKSQLAMQLANGFGEIGLKVSYIDYEQGGLISSDTQDSIKWNTTKKGLENIQIVGTLENPYSDLELIAKHTDVIVADSITDLGITADEMNKLRETYLDVIWVFISQVREDGKMYGGNKMAHNPKKVIHCHTATDHKDRYATLEKNRGNDTSIVYAISDKKIKKEVLEEKK